ncbi:MAG: AI-2E family transporter [Bacteroidota bacterium]|nr:AI-2E family transporter [Bacteroidota bacterium]
MITDHPGYRTTAYLLSFGIIIAILVVARSFLIPMTIAVLFSFLLLPISIFLENKGMPRELAIILSLLISFAILGALITFLYFEIMIFVDDFPVLKEKLNEKIVDLQRYIYRNFNVSRWEQKQWYKEQSGKFMTYSGTYITNFFTFTGELIATLFLLPIYIFFLTYYRDKIKKFLCRITPQTQDSYLVEVLRKTAKVSQKYIKGLLIDISILAVLNSTGFLILGIEHAIFLGVLAAILNLIPYIGVLIGSIFPFLLAILTEDSTSVAFGAIGVCIVVQFLDNNFITPKVVGSSVSINPLSTLIAIIIGGMLWGIAGMMLFIPLLGMLKVILDSFESTRPYGFLIGEEDDLRPMVKFTMRKEPVVVKEIQVEK